MICYSVDLYAIADIILAYSYHILRRENHEKIIGQNRGRLADAVVCASAGDVLIPAMFRQGYGKNFPPALMGMKL